MTTGIFHKHNLVSISWSSPLMSRYYKKCTWNRSSLFNKDTKNLWNAYVFQFETTICQKGKMIWERNHFKQQKKWWWGGRRVRGWGRMERGGFDECFSKNKINGLVNGEPGISLSVRKRISCFFKIALSWVKYILLRINRYCVPQKLSVILIFNSSKVHLQSDNRRT